MQTAAATHVGRVRPGNEDAYLTLPALALVADGMGGHACGDVASALAVEAFSALGEAAELEPAEVVAAVARANDAILAAAAEDEAKAGMGTTVTGVARVTEGRWLVFNVGDSRVYRIAGESAVQITEDHSAVARMVAEGRLPPELAKVHPMRNVITRSVGTDASPDVDAWLMPVADDDLFVVCSDGLTGELEDWEIAALAHGPFDGTADALVAAALERGGHDNITVIVVRSQAG
jgi:PPM family protein phosphatase